MDIEKRNRLLERIGDVNDSFRLYPLVTLEEFFEGNDVSGSICPNIWSEKDNKLLIPDSGEIFDILKSIRELDGVADVRVMVTQYDEGDDWPFSDRVVFITSRSKKNIRSLIGEKYAPDEVEFDDFSMSEHLPMPEGMRAIAAWWD